MRSRGFLTVLDLVFVMPLSGSVEFDAAHRDVRLRGSQRSGCWKSLDFRTRVGSSRSYHAAEFNVVRVGRQSPNSELSLKTSLGLDASDEASGVKRIPRGDGAFPHYEGDSALPCRRLSTLSGGAEFYLAAAESAAGTRAVWRCPAAATGSLAPRRMPSRNNVV